MKVPFHATARAAAAPAATESACTQRPPSPALLVDCFEARPYFSDGVYDKARQTHARIAAENRARIESPRDFARAVREVYEPHPLVAIIKDIFAEMEKAHPERWVAYHFEGLPLVLTATGFRTASGARVGESLGLSQQRTALSACQKLDAQLVALAENPEKVVKIHRRRGDARTPEGSDDEVVYKRPLDAFWEPLAQAQPAVAPDPRNYDEERVGPVFPIRYTQKYRD